MCMCGLKRPLLAKCDHIAVNKQHIWCVDWHLGDAMHRVLILHIAEFCAYNGLAAHLGLHEIQY